MKTSHFVLALLLGAARAYVQPCIPMSTTATLVSSTAPGRILPSSTVLLHTPQPQASTAPNATMTIDIVNLHGTDLSLLFVVGAGYSTPIGDPQPTVLPLSSTTRYLYPTGWAGQITIGPNLNSNGSKIEGSFTGPPDIDVSYVDGYTVPITCSSEGVIVTGCNIDLFMNGTCTNEVEGPVCLNPARFRRYGPPTCFFAPCEAAAYTYPEDNLANMSVLKSNLVSCCIGTLCKAPARQLSTPWWINCTYSK
ncbi:uncharacterized protein PAC_15235 [Phialocephala subalpina]|uniref:Uncharacterized protein n=1 Tax=Phialocephala subalpina TaxID=576137 RepID=A0A1L7XJV4_9HELO|nr:uncharacterized protein PAC_15235 [Phialocephala subalpina]